MSRFGLQEGLQEGRRGAKRRNEIQLHPEDMDEEEAEEVPPGEEEESGDEEPEDGEWVEIDEEKVVKWAENGNGKSHCFWSLLPVRLRQNVLFRSGGQARLRS